MDPTIALSQIHHRQDRLRRDAADERLSANGRHRERRPIPPTIEVVRRRLLPAA